MVGKGKKTIMSKILEESLYNIDYKGLRII